MNHTKIAEQLVKISNNVAESRGLDAVAKGLDLVVASLASTLSVKNLTFCFNLIAKGLDEAREEGVQNLDKIAEGLDDVFSLNFTQINKEKAKIEKICDKIAEGLDKARNTLSKESCVKKIAHTVEVENLSESRKKEFKDSLRQDQKRMKGYYRAGDKSTGRWLSWTKVLYEGERYMIYDFDADSSSPGGASAILLNPEFKKSLRFVPLTELTRGWGNKIGSVKKADTGKEYLIDLMNQSLFAARKADKEEEFYNLFDKYKSDGLPNKQAILKSVKELKLVLPSVDRDYPELPLKRPEEVQEVLPKAAGIKSAISKKREVELNRQNRIKKEYEKAKKDWIALTEDQKSMLNKGNDSVIDLSDKSESYKHMLYTYAFDFSPTTFQKLASKSGSIEEEIEQLKIDKKLILEKWDQCVNTLDDLYKQQKTLEVKIQEQNKEGKRIWMEEYIPIEERIRELKKKLEY